MRRIVLDTMVLASGFTSDAGASARLVRLWQDRRFILVVSEHTLAEIRRTLEQDRYLAPRTTAQQAAAIMASLREDAMLTELSLPVVGVATHPEDDLVLSTALSGDASILCTRDKQLLRLREYQTVSILSPGELLALLDTEALS